MTNMCNMVKLSPAFKDYIWGGTKLKTEFNKKSEFEKTAESWELSTHKGGESTIITGPYTGKKLSEYIDISREEILGKNGSAFEIFPVLIKFIDAHDSLSIQVHPDDDAFIYYGFKEKITKSEFENRIKENTLLDVLNKVHVKKGDVFFIKSGTVHAIGKGNLICEVQQNSNTTYRVYDYNRKDKDGNTRPLHVKKALDCSNLTPPENNDFGKSIKTDSYERETLAECNYFKTDKITITDNAKISITPDSFHSVIVIDGEGQIGVGDEILPFTKGDSIFIPAGYDDFTVTGNAQIMLSYV